MARPSKITMPGVADRIVQATRLGNHRRVAARAAGISESTLFEWMSRGHTETTGPYREFVDRLEAAEAEAEVYAVAIVAQAIRDGDHRAALAFLERRFPEGWRRRTSTELTGRNGGPIEARHEHRLDLSQLTDEELAILERIHARPDAG